MSIGLMVSVEVIYLLKWIIEHGEEALDVLITKAIEGGCLEASENSQLPSEQSLLEFQNVFMRIITCLEQSIDKHTARHHGSVVSPELLMDRLQGCRLKPELIIASVKAANVYGRDLLKKNPEAIFSEEDALKKVFACLLKGWKPSKRDAHA